MTQSTTQARSNESGFTLVELAIVMIIIGLLIGGILKGQELINNARLSSTVTQAKAVESGISGFRDKYANFPGDVVNPVARIPNCAASTNCSGTAGGVGNGDGQVQTGTANDPTAASAITNEAGVSLAQLGAAGFLGGVQPQLAAALLAGSSHPTTPLGGVWNFGYSDGATAATVITGTANPLPGHYIWTSNVPGAVAAATTLPLEPAQALSIDAKVDDGMPNTGSTRAVGGNTCAAATATDLYLSATTGKVCGVLIKVQ